MGDLPKEKRKEWSHCNGWPTQVEEWPHCNGWPTQIKTWRMVSLSWVTYPEKNVGLIVMGDLPRWKKCDVRSYYNGWPNPMEDRKKIWSGLIVMGDLPRWKKYDVRSHYNGWPTQMEDRKNMKWSHCYGWPTQVEDRKKYEVVSL